MFLSEKGASTVPQALVPACFKNHGNYVISLGALCRWLGQQAEALGVEIYAGFAGAEVLFDEQNRVAGVITGDMGVQKDGSRGVNFQQGMALRAAYTLFAEGARGHLGKQLERKYALRENVDPPKYGLGIKELWEVPADKHQPGLVVHTAGWPLDSGTYGGSFMYHYGERRVAIGYVVGLDYENPHLSPFEEFQRYKTHPSIRPFLEGGRRIAYGARAISAGGLQSLPKLVFAGGALIGDDAGLLNAARIKGSHTAMKSGALAAESAFAALGERRAQDELVSYPYQLFDGWVYKELYAARNFKPLMKKGLWLGSVLFGIDQMLWRGLAPWTLHHKQTDCGSLKAATQCKPIVYPKPDGVVSFDLSSSVFLSNTHHEENQPCHLRLDEPCKAISLNLAQYASPESHYCPAGVYEIVKEGQGARLQINAQNCVHCKTCDIKDPTQNITWMPPQGGEGPIYEEM